MTPLPSYLRLGGHTIKVMRVPGLIKDQDAFGTWNDEDLTICIDAGLKSSLAWETLLHEILESCNDSAELGLPHNTIQALGLLLHQALQPLIEGGIGA